METSSAAARSSSLTPWPSLPTISAHRARQVHLFQAPRVPRRAAPARRRRRPPCAAAGPRAPAPRPPRARTAGGRASPPRRAAVLGLNGLTCPSGTARRWRRRPPPCGRWCRRCRGPAGRRAPPPGCCRGKADRASTTGGRTSAITPWLVSVPATPWNSASGSTATRTPASRRTCASTADRTDSAASTVFTSQSLRSASSSRWKVSATQQPVRGERAARDGPAHVLEQGICGAGDDFGLRHLTMVI